MADQRERPRRRRALVPPSATSSLSAAPPKRPPPVPRAAGLPVPTAQPPSPSASSWNQTSSQRGGRGEAPTPPQRTLPEKKACQDQRTIRDQGTHPLAGACLGSPRSLAASGAALTVRPGHPSPGATSSFSAAPLGSLRTMHSSAPEAQQVLVVLRRPSARPLCHGQLACPCRPRNNLPPTPDACLGGQALGALCHRRLIRPCRPAQ